MTIAISTIQRPNKSPYLDRLIKSIRKDYDGLIYLIVGGKDTGYTKKYMNQGKLQYVKRYINEEEKALATNAQKASLGYVTALNLDRNEPLLLFEDDAELVDGWYKKLQNILTYTAEDRYILSLITPGRDSVPMPDIEVPSLQKFIYHSYLSYHTPGHPISTISTYSNTTGIYYPAAILQTRLAEYIYKFSVKGDAVYDLPIGQFMFRHNIPIYIAVPNLLKAVDSTDSSLGSIKKRNTANYSDWDYKTF